MRVKSERLRRWLQDGLAISGEADIAAFLAALRQGNFSLEQGSRLAAWLEYLDRALADEELDKEVGEVSSLRRARDEAEAANRAKSAFLASMSHEIRTPMNGILGMTELALDTELTGEQRNYLRTIKSSGEALLTILNDILDFSKIEAGHLQFEDIDFQVASTVGDAVKALAVKAQEKGLEVLLVFDPKVPRFLRGDPGRLRQVLMNLVGNAIKFTERGQIEVRVRLDRSIADGAVLHFEVRDTGIGIPAEKHAEIFGAFSQADASTARRFGGTGLGLSICRRLVAMMNGQIELASTPGEGSVFSFTAHFRPAVEMQQAIVGSSSRLVGQRALIIDDNRAAARQTGLQLQGWGMKVQLAFSGDEAMGKTREGNGFDVVLVDAAMPGMNGIEVIRRLLKEGVPASKFILMTTIFGQKQEHLLAEQIGVQYRLAKPFLSDELLDALLARQGEPAVELAPFEIEAAQSGQKSASLNVLVAEDNAVNQVVVTKLLEKAGHKVTVVANGQEAVERFGQEKFDLILMDVQMPVMDGIEATQAIRTREQRRSVVFSAGWRRTPIVALTAHAMEGDRDISLSAGMDGHLTKPLNSKELLAVLDRVAKGETLAGPSPGHDGRQLVDLETARKRLGDSDAALGKAADRYLQDVQSVLLDVESALSAGDRERLVVTTRNLRDLAAPFCSVVVDDAVDALEASAVVGDFASLAGKVLALRAGAEGLAQALRLEGGR